MLIQYNNTSAVSSPICRLEKHFTERLSNLPKITQLESIGNET